MTLNADDGPRSLIDPSLAYARTPVPDGVQLRLDANEGIAPPLDSIFAALQARGGELLRRYPDTRPLEASLAREFAVDPSQVIVTAGADEAIDRCCRTFLSPDSSLLMAEPGFEMFDRYAALCRARVVKAPWAPGAFPIEAMLDRVDERTTVVAMVSPNNPTGEVGSLEDLRRLSAAAPRALVIFDHAYVDFADEDLTAAALALPNVVVLRTFSKAWGLAGCRVGYAIGPAGIITPMRAAGGPYSVSALSLAVASELLAGGSARREAYIARIRHEREIVYDLLRRGNARPRVSQANFVFAELGERSSGVHAALVSHGVLVRALRNSAGEPASLRISLPGDAESFPILTSALEAALSLPPGGAPR